VDPDILIPEDLCDLGLAAAQAILRRATEDGGGEADTGGCRPFYSPEAWREREEEYGTDSLLVVVHDGGCFAPYFNLDYRCYDKYEDMQKMLKPLGLYAESCTCWYSAVYRIKA
jgi:hypothetical protein